MITDVIKSTKHTVRYGGISYGKSYANKLFLMECKLMGIKAIEVSYDKHRR